LSTTIRIGGTGEGRFLLALVAVEVLFIAALFAGLSATGLCSIMLPPIRRLEKRRAVFILNGLAFQWVNEVESGFIFNPLGFNEFL
jgi:hypothetical protein